MNCVINQCDKLASARGVCRRHYLQAWRTDCLDSYDYQRTKPSNISYEHQFWSRTAIVPFQDACYLWQGSVINSGYGVFNPGLEANVLVHRYAYQITYGSIPGDLTIDHACETKLCVNPEHLYLATREDNTKKTAQKITHCHNGHEFTEANTYKYATKRGWAFRYCRMCRKLAAREQRKKDHVK